MIFLWPAVVSYDFLVEDPYFIAISLIVTLILLDNFIWESADEDPKNPEVMLPVNQELVRRWCTITVQNAIRGWKNKNKRKYYKKWKLFSPQERDQIKLERITRIEWESFFEYLEKPEKMVNFISHSFMS